MFGGSSNAGSSVNTAASDYRRLRLPQAPPPSGSLTADSKRIAPVWVSWTKKTNGLLKVMGVDLMAAEAIPTTAVAAEATVPYFVTCKVAFCFTSLSWVASLVMPEKSAAGPKASLIPIELSVEERSRVEEMLTEGISRSTGCSESPFVMWCRVDESRVATN